MKRILLIGFILFVVFILLLKKENGPLVSQNGISTYQLADDIMTKYDLNSDKLLDVVKESFLRIEINNVLKTESRGLLFTDADKFGNNNGSVSKNELEDYLQEFDTDSDGELTSFKNIFDSMFNGKSEWSNFDNKYGEKYKYEEIEN